ncbi:MAG: flagellar motor switch protein FliN [Candidatus Phaeomarinobacter sp.]
MSDETDMQLDELPTDGAPPATGDDFPAADADLPVPTEGAEGEGLGDGAEERFATDLEAVFDVPVHVSAVLGKTNMEVSQLLKLGRGAVVELDRKVGEAIDIYVNNRLVARGEVVVVDERLGVTMTEIIKGGNAA